MTREKFVAWHISTYGNHHGYKHDTTAYCDDLVELAWMAWQAATAEQDAEIEPLRQSLQSMVDMMESGDEHGEGSNWYLKAKAALAKAKQENK